MKYYAPSPFAAIQVGADIRTRGAGIYEGIRRAVTFAFLDLPPEEQPSDHRFRIDRGAPDVAFKMPTNADKSTVVVEATFPTMDGHAPVRLGCGAKPTRWAW